MADTIQAQTDAGLTVYTLIRNSAGQVWNGSTFTAYLTANLSTYAVTLTQQGTASGFYTAAFPSAITAGVYSVVAKSRAGGSPAESDLTVAAGGYDWDGANLVPLERIALQTDKLTFDGHNPPNVLADLFATDTTAVNVAAIKAKTDNLPASPAAVGSAMTLTSAALDAILVESGITAGAGLVNDAGTQLTAINARQALAAILSAVAAVLSGAGGTSVAIKPAGKPGASDRIDATVDSSGDRTAINLRVPT